MNTKKLELKVPFFLASKKKKIRINQTKVGKMYLYIQIYKTMMKEKITEGSRWLSWLRAQILVLVQVMISWMVG